MSLSNSLDQVDQKPGLDSYKSLSVTDRIENVEKGDIVMVKPEYSEKLGLDPDQAYCVYKVNKEKGRICIVVNGYPEPKSLKMGKFDLYETKKYPIVNVMSQMQSVNKDVATVLARRIRPSQKFPENRHYGVFVDGDGTLYELNPGRMESYNREHHRNLGHDIGPMTVKDI